MMDVMIRRILFLGVVTLLASGCGVRTWVDLEIGPDGSGEVMFALAGDEELRAGLATFSPDADPVETARPELEAAGWTVEDTVDGDWQGILAQRAFADLAELDQALGEAFQADRPIELTETDTGYRLYGELGSGEDMGALAQGLDVIDLDGRFSVTFPGEVVSSNGEVAGTTVTWTFDAESLAGLVLEAEARKPASLVPWLIGGVTVVLAVAAGWLVIRSWARDRGV
jgi:hypothetical protein